MQHITISPQFQVTGKESPPRYIGEGQSRGLVMCNYLVFSFFYLVLGDSANTTRESATVTSVRKDPSMCSTLMMFICELIESSASIQQQVTCSLIV